MTSLRGKSGNSGKNGWIVATAGAAVAFVLGVWVYQTYFRNSTQGEDSRNRWFVCAETRKPFKARIEVGTTIPIESPFSHKPTGYPAELCFWTAEGTIKSAPTPVLLNRYADPNDNSPTFCPDCGRLVVGHNPPPVEGHPPPTREEWTLQHGGAPPANPETK